MKKNLYILILVVLLFVTALSVFTYKNYFKNTDYKVTTTYPYTDANGWEISNDCRNIKLSSDEKSDPESGLANEQDIAINQELKIVSIGLPEKVYGPKKRLEVSYAKLTDYTDCSPNVRQIIDSISPQ